MKQKVGSRYLILISGIVLAVVVCMFQVFTAKGQEPGKGSAREGITYRFTTNTIYYSGIYTGEMRNGLPNGKGIFEADEESPCLFTYEGEFENGQYHGKGKITYENGETLSGKFKEGNPSGKMTYTYTDGTYASILYHSSIPYSVSEVYTKDGKLKNREFYYDGVRISEWKKDAQEVEYRSLYDEMDQYYGQMIKLDCTVLDIYESKETCIFKVKDKDGNIYWGEYENITQRKFSQALMPTLNVGDELELYAFYAGLEIYDCDKEDRDFGYSFPKLKPVTAKTADDTLDYTNLSYEYDTVKRFPYHYYYMSARIDGTVQNIRRGEKTIHLKVSDKEGNLYDVSMKKEKFERIPIRGDRVSIKGRYAGLHKEGALDVLDEATEIYIAVKAGSVKIKG